MSFIRKRYKSYTNIKIMNSNLKIILGEFEKYKGQFVITDMNVVERLIGIGEDEWDYYYITWDGRRTHWNTCVGAIIPLKGFIKDKDYERLVRIAKLNHFDSAEMYRINTPEIKEYIKKVREEVENLSRKNGRYLAPICWEIN